MLNYNHLYYFHMAGLEGSVASAAGRLRVTQPTVSEQVRALEKSLGVALFERLPTGLRLTEAGKLTFEHTSIMFRASERLAEALGHGERGMPHALRVGISGAVGRATSASFLLPLLAVENCIPSIRSADGAELLRDLRASELDLVLSESEPPEVVRQGLHVKRLEQLTLVAVGPEQLEPAPDWTNIGLVHYRPSSAFRWDVETYLQTNSLRPKIVGETDDALFLLEAAACGNYVAFVPRSVARDAITTGRVKVLARVDSTRAGVYALYPDAVTADLARRAVDSLVEHLKLQSVEP